MLTTMEWGPRRLLTDRTIVVLENPQSYGRNHGIHTTGASQVGRSICTQPLASWFLGLIPGAPQDMDLYSPPLLQQTTTKKSVLYS